MKTNIISFVAIILISMMAMGFTHKTTDKNTILIQSVNNDISSTDLTRSAQIISNRLKDFSTDKFEVTFIPEKHQIQVKGSNESNIHTVESLVTQKGRIEFYITYNHSELSKLLPESNQLFSMLDKKGTKDSNPWIGCTSLSKINTVNEYLNLKGKLQHCRFVWSDFTDSTKVCLYALKLGRDKGSLLSGNDFVKRKIHSG